MLGGLTIELAAACSDIAAAQDVAGRLGGRVYVDEREDTEDLPFRALLTTVTDDPGALASAGDVGSYVICRRPIKVGDYAVAALFPLVRRSGLDHRDADRHWRDVHAPLALKHHGFMTSYTQLSVLHRLSGEEFDGFALCGFGSLEDLKHRFFTGPGSREAVAADVRKMADVARSPRRLIVVERRWPASGDSSLQR
jgi:uncharacterized protein (TIGR02118 family)